MKTDDYKQVREIQLPFDGKIGKNVAQKVNQYILILIFFKSLCMKRTLIEDAATDACNVQLFLSATECVPLSEFRGSAFFRHFRRNSLFSQAP